MKWRALVRGVATLLFWLATALAAATVALFLWAAMPVLATRANGGWAALWLFGDAGVVVGAAWAWLAAVAVLGWRRRLPRKRPPA